jgi:hypothetical protein
MNEYCSDWFALEETHMDVFKLGYMHHSILVKFGGMGSVDGLVGTMLAL